MLDEKVEVAVSNAEAYKELQVIKKNNAEGLDLYSLSILDIRLKSALKRQLVFDGYAFYEPSHLSRCNGVGEGTVLINKQHFQVISTLVYRNDSILEDGVAELLTHSQTTLHFGGEYIREAVANFGDQNNNVDYHRKKCRDPYDLNLEEF